MAAFTIPPGNKVAGQAGFVADIDSLYTAVAAIAGVNVLNSAYAGGADPTGATDSTAAIQAAITAASSGGIVYLPPGTYLLNGSAGLSVTTAGTRIVGAGPKSAVLQIGASFTGSQAVELNAEACAVENLTIAGTSSATTSNPAADAIYLAGQRFCRVSTVEFEYINGWCVESIATASSAGYGTMLDRLSTYKNCAGGIHVKSVTGVGWGAQHFLSNINLQQVGVGSGTFANLDAVMLEDCWDITAAVVNASVSDASTGSAMHIKGKCATIYLADMDLGCNPNGSGTNSVWLIEDGTNGSPVDVQVVNGVGQQGTIGLRVTGGANDLRFTNFRAWNNYTHGVSIEGTGANIDFAKLYAGQNGQGASGSNYDLQWTSTASGLLSDVTLASPVVSTGTAGVQAPANLSSGNLIRAINWSGNGTGTTSSNMFVSSNAPKEYHYVRPWSPRGLQAVTVPSSGTATAAFGNDRWFYVTAASSGTTTVAVSGSAAATITIPASACVPVFLPAGSTLTPSYSSAPTWVVFGN